MVTPIRRGDGQENSPRRHAVVALNTEVHADKTRDGRRRPSACGFLLIEDTLMFAGKLLIPSRLDPQEETPDWLIPGRRSRLRSTPFACAEDEEDERRDDEDDDEDDDDDLDDDEDFDDDFDDDDDFDEDYDDDDFDDDDFDDDLDDDDDDEDDEEDDLGDEDVRFRLSRRCPRQGDKEKGADQGESSFLLLVHLSPCLPLLLVLDGDDILCTSFGDGYNQERIRRGVQPIRGGFVSSAVRTLQGEANAKSGKHFNEGPESSAAGQPSARVPDQHQLEFELGFLRGRSGRCPDYVDVLRIMGNLLTLKGRFADGLQIDKRLVQLRPNDALAHYNLACSFALLKRPEHRSRRCAEPSNWAIATSAI